MLPEQVGFTVVMFPDRLAAFTVELDSHAPVTVTVLVTNEPWTGAVIDTVGATVSKITDNDSELVFPASSTSLTVIGLDPFPIVKCTGRLYELALTDPQVKT